MTDEYGRIELSEDERATLRAIWESPKSRDVIVSVGRQFLDQRMNMLRTCAAEDIPKVRAQLDIMERFFAVFDRSTKNTAEINAERAAVAGPPQMTGI